jgi:hypothetical protein
MAELEVAKHTKNVVALAASTQHGPWDKVRELLLEAMVIVFAVSISIWFHSMGEHRHEQAQVKAFLSGLRADLGNDVAEIANARTNYQTFEANFAALAALSRTAPPPADFDSRYALTGNNVSFNPRMSRYLGFQSSGKLTNIENPEILGRIVELYQDQLPLLRVSELGWGARHDKLRDYLSLDYDLDTGADRRFERITSPMGRRLLERAIVSPQMYQRFDRYAKLANEIIAEIDKTYPDLKK